MLDRATPEGDTDRRDRILAAAERAFVRQGFHAASMQSIAAEARMSAGNLYRYFGSKEALVYGLIARDQATIARDFQDLSESGDIFAAFAASLRRHLVESPVERHRLIVEIWAEMSRNSAIAIHGKGVDSAFHARLKLIVDAARRRGAAAPGIDPDFVVRVIATMVAGLFKRRATEPSFDGEAEVALALGVIRAAFDGRLSPERTAATAVVS